ncbi:hypothetical protein PH213_11710 [Streptomyces sp. SRF1]|uniref:hypothetical protein n=1 Tax=Streptomyces sp. SRF1 TaxID=1549642 RepID=UPI0025B023FA|nr:hypothetical protein [Streptomyces sp. SRF1]MDN3055198.1 hypothetical protein [Streptomyces sp. SRF1]
MALAQRAGLSSTAARLGHLRADVRRRFHRRRQHLAGHLPCRSTPSVVMFLIAQRYIVEGIATGGLKG